MYLCGDRRFHLQGGDAALHPRPQLRMRLIGALCNSSGWGEMALEIRAGVSWPRGKARGTALRVVLWICCSRLRVPAEMFTRRC
jgi:hypothetical protein